VVSGMALSWQFAATGGSSPGRGRRRALAGRLMWPSLRRRQVGRAPATTERFDEERARRQPPRGDVDGGSLAGQPHTLGRDDLQIRRGAGAIAVLSQRERSLGGCDGVG